MKIAFLDHHLANYHSQVFLKILREDLATEDVEVSAAYEIAPKGDEDWCSTHGVRRAASVQEAMEGVDGAFVLAPDSIEAHPGLCEQAAPFGKPLFIDKLLAPDLSRSEQIVELAHRHSAPFLASSALWHAVELERALKDAEAPTEAFARGYGVWEHYGVHTVSLCVRALGAGFSSLLASGSAEARQIAIGYPDGRTGSLQCVAGPNASETFPWWFALRTPERFVSDRVIDYHGFYVNQVRDAIRLVRTGETSMTPAEALAVAEVIDRGRA